MDHETPLPELVDRLAKALGQPGRLQVDRLDASHAYRVEGVERVGPFAERRHTASELAQCLHFALATLDTLTYPHPDDREPELPARLDALGVLILRGSWSLDLRSENDPAALVYRQVAEPAARALIDGARYLRGPFRRGEPRAVRPGP